MNTNIEIIENNKKITVQAEKNINPALGYLISLQSRQSRKTMSSYLNSISKILGHENINTTPWHLLRRHHIQMIVSTLIEKGYSPATINTYLAALKGVAFESWTAELITAHEYQTIKHIKSVKGNRITKGTLINKAQIQKILSSGDGSELTIRNNAIFAVLISCGLRRNEIVSLSVSSIDFENKTMIIRGKGNKERIAYLPNNVLEYIKKWLKISLLSGQDPLFTRVLKGGHITKYKLSNQAIYYLVKNIQTELGFKSLSPHDFRRTFATYLLQQGEDLFTVQKAMGHSSVQTTQTYDLRPLESLKHISTHFNWLNSERPQTL